MTFSFAEYVEAQDQFRVSGKVEVYWPDEALFTEVRSFQETSETLWRGDGKGSCTAIVRFIRDVTRHA